MAFGCSSCCLALPGELPPPGPSCLLLTGGGGGGCHPVPQTPPDWRFQPAPEAALGGPGRR
eukprot:5013319-Alexandrium_andersonii.AAC.1